MASKTYLPALLNLLHRICVYIVRYRMTLEKSILPIAGEPGIAALNAVVVACETFTDLINLPVNP